MSDEARARSSRAVEHLPDIPPSTEAGWLGADLALTPDRWTYSWEPQILEDLLAVANEFLANPSTLAQGAQFNVSSELEAFGENIRSELIEGLGFTLIKGFPVGDIAPELEAVGFLVLGRLLGGLRSQNAMGHLLGHVKDVGRDAEDPDTRIYQTNERQTFHTDSTDAVGLLCRRPAQSGGRSLLASAETIYRQAAERRPDLAPLLFEPVATDRRGEIPDGADPWFEIPVLNWYDDRLTVIYQRTYIDSAQRFDGAPKLTPEHVEALDLVDEIANDPDVHLTMDLEPGDIQFVYNHALLHDRTGFVDHPDPAQRRHLLRLWVTLPGDRELPPIFKQRYGSIAVGDRGGVTVPGTVATVPFDVA